jgi:hypothetical protein
MKKCELTELPMSIMMSQVEGEPDFDDDKHANDLLFEFGLQQ